jgi:hypothetical protein
VKRNTSARVPDVKLFYIFANMEFIKLIEEERIKAKLTRQGLYFKASISKSRYYRVLEKPYLLTYAEAKALLNALNLDFIVINKNFRKHTGE